MTGRPLTDDGELPSPSSRVLPLSHRNELMTLRRPADPPGLDSESGTRNSRAETTAFWADRGLARRLKNPRNQIFNAQRRRCPGLTGDGHPVPRSYPGDTLKGALRSPLNGERDLSADAFPLSAPAADCGSPRIRGHWRPIPPHACRRAAHPPLCSPVRTPSPLLTLTVDRGILPMHPDNSLLN